MKLKVFGICFILSGILGISGCSSYEGLRIISPENEQTVAELQPTLRWEAVPGQSVTYDLAIYEAEEINPFYYKEGLQETSHRVEIELKPRTTYRWSVRSRSDGSVSEWTKHETKVFTGVSYHRRAKFMRFSTH